MDWQSGILDSSSWISEAIILRKFLPLIAVPQSGYVGNRGLAPWIAKGLGFVFTSFPVYLQLAPLGAEPRTFHFFPEYLGQLYALQYHESSPNGMLLLVWCAGMAERLHFWALDWNSWH